MSDRELVVLIGGAEAGRVHSVRNARLRFEYVDAWRRRDDAPYLSLSMPLGTTAHGHDAIHAYLWGLLPDNEHVLTRWGQRFQVSPRSAFGLLSHVGEDCAGAVQLLRPERHEDPAVAGPRRIEWLSDSDVAARLRDLRADQAAWRGPSDTGQFSLAGAQPKTALFMENDRFGVPEGRTPTTHILKPPLRDRPGHVENEHLCLALAREVGLAAATSEVRRFDDEVAIVITRYDRVRHGARGPVLRVHQEDMCQALAVLPAAKYQSEGGPTPRRIAELLREHSERPDEDVPAFFDALAFNWLTAGTDGHAKNYSLLHAAGGRVRLAPLYDLASALLYPGLDPQRLRLAMKVGSKYRIRDIVGRDWIDLAEDLGLSASTAVDRIGRMAEDVPGQAERIGTAMVDAGLDRATVRRLVDVISRHARRCQKALAARGP